LTEFEQRCRSVSLRLATHKVNALLVSSPANVRYLSGYTGSNGLMLILEREAHFFTDPRYTLEVSRGITAKVHIAKGPLTDEAAKLIKRKKLKKIGFEPASLTYEAYARIKDELPLGASLVPVAKIVGDLRSIKSPSEIDKIRQSVLVNSEAYARTLKRIRVGVKEQEIAAELEFQMRVLGAEKPAFETIVAAGTRTALPHAHPTSHRFAANELLLIDVGATVDGYASDMTRVAYAGQPSQRIRELYGAVLEAQLAAIRAVKSGVEARKVDGAARDVLKRHQLDRAFVHSTGHGLGLEIHEMPRVARKEKSRLRPGMVITIEPGAYIGELGGVRIEDTVLVTDQGCEVLTPTTKDFVTL
jgi:Xaa-Pro aminopeptidase